MFANKTVIITGSGAGIGRGIAIEFAKRDANLILLDKREDALKESKQICLRTGLKESQIVMVLGDIREEEVQLKLLERAEKIFNGLHVLVNNAGINKPVSILNFDMKDYYDMLNVNLNAVVSMCVKAIPALKKTKGNIVNISSVCSTRAINGIMPYCVSKAGVDMLTRCLATELATQGVRVNAVNPGVIGTEILESMTKGDESLLKEFRAAQPMNCIGDVEDIAQAVIFLASDNAKFITGATMHVDGGASTNQLHVSYRI